MNQGTCETCRWWDTSSAANGYGHCRFNPPAPVFCGEQYGVEACFPCLGKSEWCSHHTPKPDEKPPQQAYTVLGWNNASEIKPLPATGEKGENPPPRKAPRCPACGCDTGMQWALFNGIQRCLGCGSDQFGNMLT